MSSTVDRIHARIYDAIVEQQLPPGTKLGEESLCEIFGVSRTLIRRVLQRLASEHVVEALPHRGAFVARPSVGQAREVFEARRAIEAWVSRQLVDRFTADDAERLRLHVVEERRAHDDGDRRAVIRLSGEFHLLLAELAGNRAIARFLRELVSRTSLIIAVYEAPGASCCSFDEHAGIIDALAGRDAAAALRAMHDHLVGIEERLRLDRLPERTIDLQQVLAGAPRSRRRVRPAVPRVGVSDALSPGD